MSSRRHIPPSASSAPQQQGLLPPGAPAFPQAPAQAAPPPPPAPRPERSADVGPPPPLESDNSRTWRDRAASWEGRWTAARKTASEMQEQMNQLGQELLYAQQQLQSLQQRPALQQQPQYTPPPPPTQPLVTEKDAQDYGHELIDLNRRVALEAMAPHLQAMHQENAYLQQRLHDEAKRRLDQQLEMAVPDFREINNNPRWHNWLRGIDVLSGRVRQSLLNEAVAAANAPRVISFFRSFLNEERATGHIAPAPYPQQAVPPPPREPAVPLAAYAAPGRLRPANGEDTLIPPEKPIYTRADIARYYALHRR